MHPDGSGNFLLPSRHPQRVLLETLLEVPAGEWQTPLDRLRRGPTRVSGPALVTALHRVEAIHLFEMEHLDLSFIPRGRLKALARHATTALVQHYLDAEVPVLAQACQIVLDATQYPVTLLQRIYTSVPSEHLRAAVTTVGELTRPPDDNYAQELLGRYLMMRRFLPTFWHTLEFESTPGGRPTLQNVQFLQQIEGRSRSAMQRAPRAVIPRSWQRHVLECHPEPIQGEPETRVNHQAYTVCWGSACMRNYAATMSLLSRANVGAIRARSCSNPNNGKVFEHRSVKRWVRGAC